MTDQTPPPDQPTPAPVEGAGPVEGATPPPPPPPPDDTAVGAVPPPPPAAPKKSRTGLVIGLVAGLLALAVIAAVLVVVFVVNGEEKHSIAVTSTAGGMKRDTAKEKELKTQLDAAEEQFKTQFKNDKGVSYVKSGVYNQTDSKRGPEGALVFLGAKLKLSDKDAAKNATDFVGRVRKQASTNGFKVENIAVGEAGGKAVCASQGASAQKISICAWATKDSGGELIPTVPGYDSKQLSKIMLDLRSDVETTE